MRKSLSANDAAGIRRRFCCRSAGSSNQSRPGNVDVERIRSQRKTGEDEEKNRKGMEGGEIEMETTRRMKERGREAMRSE